MDRRAAFKMFVNSRRMPPAHHIRRYAIDRANAVHVLRWIVRSEEHTSELQSLMRISYAVFCLKKKKIKNTTMKTQTHNQIDMSIINISDILEKILPLVVYL